MWLIDSPMNILALHASPRRKNSNTLILLEAVLEGCRNEGAATEMIDLAYAAIGYCRGCGTCYKTGSCVQEDDFQEIFAKFLAADGIVLSSPNYIMNVTAPMKAFFDRLGDAIHCQQGTGKYGCSVATAGGSKSAEVCSYMNSVLQILGATTVGEVAVDIAGNPTAFTRALPEAKELGATLVRAIAEEWHDPVQDVFHQEMHENMKGLILSDREAFAHEIAYWSEKGWL